MFSFGWYKSYENRIFRTNWQRWQSRHNELQSEGSIALSKLREDLRTIHGKSEVRRRLEEKLNEGKPFDYIRQDQRDETVWKDPRYNIRVELSFDGDNLVGWGTSWGTGDLIQRYPPPPMMASQTVSNQIRDWLVSFCFYGWWLAVASWVLLKRFRIVATEFMLAISLATGTVLLANPLYSLTWRGITSNDNLFWAVLMLIISIYLLARMTVKDVVPIETSFSMRFRLKHILLSITVIAIMLAAGPFGYVTLAVSIASGIAFVFFYQWQLMLTPTSVGQYTAKS